MDHAQRALGRGVARLRHRDPRAGGGPTTRSRSPRPTTCSPTASHATRPAAGSGSRSTSSPHPVTDDPEDVRAARLADLNMNALYLDPLFGRGYPPDLVDHYAGASFDVSSATAISRRSPGRSSSSG